MESKMKRLFPLLALLAGASPCLAQSAPAPAARNAVFFEVLGSGGLYSFNYERMLNDRVGVRVGYAVWESPLLFEGTPPDRYRTLPVTASYLLGGGERKLELGGGMMFGSGTFDRFNNSDERRDFSFRNLTAIVGYRSQARHGYLFRVALTPFYSFDEGEEAYPDPGFTLSAGVSFGYRF